MRMGSAGWQPALPRPEQSLRYSQFSVRCSPPQLSVGRWTFGVESYLPSMKAGTPSVPDATGHFGPYGGMFVPETLMSALNDLAAEYDRAKDDPTFQDELATLLRDFAG